jgi:hypothetical protein
MFSELLVMNPKHLRIRRNRLLIISIILFVLGLALLYLFLRLAPPYVKVVLGTDGRYLDRSNIPGTLILTAVFGVVSVVSSVGTFVGFLSTTVIMWRKEIRDSRSAKLDNRLKEMQMLKLSKEIKSTPPK